MNNTIKSCGLGSTALLALSCATLGFGQTPAPVQVKNTTQQPVLVRDLGNNPQKAVAFRFNLQFGGINVATFPQKYVVPGGKRLVIEHITYDLEVKPGQSMTAGITTRLDNQGFTSLYGPNHRKPSNGGEFLSGDRMVKLYADAWTEVTGAMWVNGTNPGNLGNMTFHGYLVDMPLEFVPAQ